MEFKQVKDAAHKQFFHSLLSLPKSTRDENLSLVFAFDVVLAVGNAGY